MVVKGSYRTLAREIGYQEGGDQFRAIRKCIERLWTVSIIAQKGRKRQGFRLLADYASDEADARLYVALNPLIAQAVMGAVSTFESAWMRSERSNEWSELVVLLSSLGYEKKEMQGSRVRFFNA